jgi:membrane protein YdbS with pleckstrin-like domain
MRFKASLDRLAKAVTTSISILFAVIIVTQISVYVAGAHATALITSIAIVLIYFITYAFRPIHYNVTNDQLIIHRPVRDIIIERKNIKRVQPITKEQMKWHARTFGVGGFFGYYGHFVILNLEI